MTRGRKLRLPLFSVLNDDQIKFGQNGIEQASGNVATPSLEIQGPSLSTYSNVERAQLSDTSWRFRISTPGLRFPSHGRLRRTGYPVRLSAEGRNDWPNLLREKLPFSISIRFSPGTP